MTEFKELCVKHVTDGQSMSLAACATRIDAQHPHTIPQTALQVWTADITVTSITPLTDERQIFPRQTSARHFCIILLLSRMIFCSEAGRHNWPSASEKVGWLQQTNCRTVARLFRCDRNWHRGLSSQTCGVHHRYLDAVAASYRRRP